MSGQKSIKMDTLSQMYVSLGFENVKTYLQSGNVVFETEGQDVSELEEGICRQIKLDYGYDVPVIVFEANDFEQIANNNPFLYDDRKDQSFFHVTFLSSLSHIGNSEEVEKSKQGEEEIELRENVIYLYCPNGYGKTKLTNNFIESKLKITATTRNWKTVKALLEIVSQ